GEILKATAADVFAYTTQEDFYARCNTEQTEYHGDPAIRLNPHPKPDYVIEDSMVKINPAFVSVADHSFAVTASFLNIGKSPNAPIVLEIKRQLSDGSVIPISRDTIPGIRYSTSITVNVPINNPEKEKGLNKIIVTVDPDNTVDELFENNNSVTKDLMIFDEEVRPVYPYNYSIVNRQNIKLTASTANPFDSAKQYLMELDTTALFNSPLKVSKSVVSKGGAIEFDAGTTFSDHTVYYWRTAPASTNNLNWNTASFVYIANGDSGFNQSHFYQHTNSTIKDISLDSVSRKWNFRTIQNNLFIRNGVFPTAANQGADFAVSINGDATLIISVCGLPNIIVNVFDPFTFKPWFNALAGDPSQYGSDPVCGNDRRYNFQFTTSDTAKRRLLMQFLDFIPDGYIVVVRNTAGTSYSANTYPSDWLNDTVRLGSGNSIYYRLYNQGFNEIDSFNRPRAWIFTYVKNNQQKFTPKYTFSQGIYDRISLSADFATPDSLGTITSPAFGPMKAWKQMRWDGTIIDNSAGDAPTIDIVGIKPDGTQDVVVNKIDVTRPVVDISAINAIKYPYLQLQMRNIDSVHFTPYQLTSWQLTGTPAPEGAVNPTQYFYMKDTLDVGEPLQFKMAFKNVSDYKFSDSIKIKAIIVDKNGTTHVIPPWKQRALAATPDTINVSYPLDTRKLTGANNLYVEVNPDNDQPELYHFNNFFYRNFYVRADTINPLLDVTFDNVHILNHDIVSSRPNILIKLKDESKWYLIDDSASLRIQVRYPDGSVHPYNFKSDTLQFVPASQQVPTTNNSASAILKPYFPVDGEYELMVSGRDMSQNTAGAIQYQVAFEVYNKPMISNMLNYPNPFTTSTAFVFTLTGSEVPQNLKIEILTVTGKIVREITKDELGPLHIGRNITEFKWDGTDQYGQKLANGVYLYRVVTNLNGKSLDKFTYKDDNTDKYFNKGYGKMYLMR
ncbi:MAG: CARDB domain-containing protein, partial [Flavisolibacter sp.]